jgi:dihydroneopterin aldolase
VTDRISLTGLQVFARHGVLEHEATQGQTFIVDLVLDVDLTEAGASDRLDSTVDYGSLAKRVHDLVAGERWDLIERVAERIAEVVLTDERCQGVEVTVHKPDAPIAVPFEDVSVRISRSR